MNLQPPIRNRRHGGPRSLAIGGERRHSEPPQAILASTIEEQREAAERRMAMIRDLAYRNAEARDFQPGHELDDWLAAEREVLLWEAGRRFAGD